MADAERGQEDRRRNKARRSWSRYLSVLVVCWSIWGVTMLTSGGHDLEDRPLWITLPWGAVLVRRPSLRRPGALIRSAQGRDEATGKSAHHAQAELRSDPLSHLRRVGSLLELLLVHPGGPLWAKKDEGAWSIPKGEHEPGDTPAACPAASSPRSSVSLPRGGLIELGEIVQRGGKRVHTWAYAESRCVAVHSNTFDMEWPPRSGRIRSFPGVDRATWQTAEEAGRKPVPAQVAFVDRLLELLGARVTDADHAAELRKGNGPPPTR